LYFPNYHKYIQIKREEKKYRINISSQYPKNTKNHQVVLE